MMNLRNTPDPAEAGWSSLYRVAGISALVAVLFMLADIGLSFTGGDMPVGKVSAAAWFAHLNSSWILGLRNLGFFNVINLILAVPLYLSLYHLHRQAAPAYAALALLVCIIGTAVYISGSPALSLLSLSQRYASAVDAAQKAALEAAGAVLLVQAEDFTPGSFVGFFLSSTASLIMMAVMLRGRVFSRWVSLSGLVGWTCLLVFTISATFAPATFDLAMILAMFGGILMLVWNIAVALKLFRLGQVAKKQAPAVSAGFMPS